MMAGILIGAGVVFSASVAALTVLCLGCGVQSDEEQEIYEREAERQQTDVFDNVKPGEWVKIGNERGDTLTTIPFQDPDDFLEMLLISMTAHGIFLLGKEERSQ